MEIPCHELQERLQRGDPLKLIDCREPWEHQTARLKGSELIPMDQIPANLEQLRSAPEPIVVYCHHGIRSLQVVQWLRQQGVDSARSLAGGIDHWSLAIDPTVPRY